MSLLLRLEQQIHALRMRAQKLRARPPRNADNARRAAAADAGDGGPEAMPAMPRAPVGTDTRVYRRSSGPEVAPRLRIQAGPQGTAGREFVLDRPITVIGRRADQDIVLNDSSVSRAHARLESAPGGVTLVDLGSTNGTLLNGRRVGRGRVLLRAGDRVQIGSILLVFLAAR